MSSESRKSSQATETNISQASGLLTAEERAQLRARSASARERSQAAAARCHDLKAQFEARAAEYPRWKESFERILPELRESVARYARCLKAEGEAPQRMLVLVKEAVHEVVPISEPGSSTIVDLAVGCAIEAYYDTAA